MYQCKLFGKTLITDNQLLHEILTSEVFEGDNAIHRRIEREFPTLQRETVTCMQEVAKKKVDVELLLYVNHRVQAWAGRQFDCEPSAVRFVAQAGKDYESR